MNVGVLSLAMDPIIKGSSLRTRAFAAAAGIGLALLLTSCVPYQFKGTEYLEPEPAPDFQLSRADGGTLRLSDLKDQVVLLFFGFTTCPDVCPATLTDAARILEALGEDAWQTAYLFVTVDPERDAPGTLRQYTQRFDPAIIGLTGPADDLADVWTDYGIYVEKVPIEDSGLEYTVTHTARVFVIDREGRLRLSYSFGTPYEDILQDVRHLLDG